MFNFIQWGVKKLGYLFTQVSGGDLIRNSTAIYPYGSAGNAPSNSLTLLLNIDGNTEKTVNLELSEFKDRALKEGEYLIGNFVKNSIILFDSKGNITITSKLDFNATAANSIRLKALNASINIDSLVEIKGVQSLGPILQTLITTLKGIKAGPTPTTPSMVLDQATVESLTTIAVNLQQCLK